VPEITVATESGRSRVWPNSARRFCQRAYVSFVRRFMPRPSNADLQGPSVRPQTDEKATGTVSIKAFRGRAPARPGRVYCSGETGHPEVADRCSGWRSRGIRLGGGPPIVGEGRAIPGRIHRLPLLPLFAPTTTSKRYEMLRFASVCRRLRFRYNHAKPLSAKGFWVFRRSWSKRLLTALSEVRVLVGELIFW